MSHPRIPVNPEGAERTVSISGLRQPEIVGGGANNLALEAETHADGSRRGIAPDRQFRLLADLDRISTGMTDAAAGPDRKERAHEL
jgi:hypothetical protein